MTLSWSWPLLQDPQQVMYADLIRAAVLIGCALLASACVVLLLGHEGRQMSHWQRSRFACLIFAAVYVAATEIGQLHHPVIVWRLPLAVLFLLCALYGVWGMRQGRDRLPERRKTPR